MRIEQLPISARLKMNAALVPECRTAADIGCDHAYSSIYLAATGRAGRCIAMDVVEGPLSRARENIRAYGMEGCIETRLSDGLEKLKPDEAEVLLISGMGGPLMLELLKKRPEVTQTARALVLQPQSELAGVRRSLPGLGFVLKAEDMCCEEGKYYTALYAVRAQASSGQEEDAMSRMDQQYGPCLMKERHPVLLEYLQRELRQKEELRQALVGQPTPRAQERLADLEQEIQEISCYLEGTGKVQK